MGINLSGVDDKTKITTPGCRRSTVTGDCIPSSGEKHDAGVAGNLSDLTRLLSQKKSADSSVTKKDAGVDTENAVVLINGVPIKIPIKSLLKNIQTPTP